MTDKITTYALAGATTKSNDKITQMHQTLVNCGDLANCGTDCRFPPIHSTMNAVTTKIDNVGPDEQFTATV